MSEAEWRQVDPDRRLYIIYLIGLCEPPASACFGPPQLVPAQFDLARLEPLDDLAQRLDELALVHSGLLER